MTHYAPGSARFAPPGLPPERTRQPATCSRCDRPLVYIEMVKTGKLMPCDSDQRYGNGRRHLVQRVQVGQKLLGQLVTRAGEDVLGFEPHWGTCPARPPSAPPPTKPPPPATLFDAPCPVYQLEPRPTPPRR